MNHPTKSSPIPTLARRASSEDARGAENVAVSCLLRRSRPSELSDRASILLPDILWSEMKVDHRGLNLRMPHEVHKRRQANTCAQHVGSKRMSKAVGVRFPHAGGLPVMTKQRT